MAYDQGEKALMKTPPRDQTASLEFLSYSPDDLCRRYYPQARLVEVEIIPDEVSKQR